MGRLSHVLLDIGGTIWPDRWHQTFVAGDGAERREERLCRAIPALTPAPCGDFLRTLWESPPLSDSEPHRQDTDGEVRSALRAVRLPHDDATVRAIRRAMCLPAKNHVALFDGTQELLTAIRELGLSCIVITNATWRDGDAYRRDFADFGIAQYFDAVLSSVDVGYKKPHPAFFEAALQAAGNPPPAQCIVIGNSEENDIAPAVKLGMRTLRVAIEEPKPETSEAHAVATTLSEATSTLRDWSRA